MREERKSHFKQETVYWITEISDSLVTSGTPPNSEWLQCRVCSKQEGAGTRKRAGERSGLEGSDGA